MPKIKSTFSFSYKKTTKILKNICFENEFSYRFGGFGKECIGYYCLEKKLPSIKNSFFDIWVFTHKKKIFTLFESSHFFPSLELWQKLVKILETVLPIFPKSLNFRKLRKKVFFLLYLKTKNQNCNRKILNRNYDIVQGFQVVEVEYHKSWPSLTIPENIAFFSFFLRSEIKISH